MRLIKKLFTGRKKSAAEQVVPPIFLEPQNDSANIFENVPAYLPVNTREEKKRVAILATAGLNFDHPQAKMRITRIQKRNPDYLRVAILATSCAKVLYPDQTFKICAIKKILKEAPHA